MSYGGLILIPPISTLYLIEGKPNRVDPLVGLGVIQRSYSNPTHLRPLSNQRKAKVNIVAVHDSWLYPFVHAAFLSTAFLIIISLEGCDSNFEVNFSFKFYKLLQIKQLPCIKQCVLG